MSKVITLAENHANGDCFAPLSGARNDVDRSDIAMVWIVSLWLGMVLYFNPRLFALLDAAPNLPAAIAVVVFTLCLDFFWLQTVYAAVMIAVSSRAGGPPTREGAGDALPDATSAAKVAILYTTRNDFREECADSCLNLDHPAFRVFILDDGTLPEYRKRIDEWAASRSDRVTVIRRTERSGFKAGNLNHALKRIHRDFPFFAICDADGVFPRDFIRSLLPMIENDPALAFIQARQAQNPDQPGSFAAALGCSTAAHYDRFVRGRNRFGFLMFYGHGALMRTSVWERVGGFPEIATEDLAFAAEARRIGYRGIYTDAVTCFEDFPRTYAQYRVRAEKWIRGTSEFLRRHFPAFLRARAVPWHEKLDVLINALFHYQSAAMLLFLASIGAVLPAYLDHFRYPGSFFLLPVAEGKTALEFFSRIRYHIFWSVDFYLAMLATITIPLLPAFLHLRGSPRMFLRYLAASQYAFLASLVAEAGAFLAYVTTGIAPFRNTFDAEDSDSPVSGFHPNGRPMLCAEIVVGVVLLALGWTSKNLWFFAPALALLSGSMLLHIDWRGFRAVSVQGIPLVITFLILAAVTLDLVMAGVDREFRPSEPSSRYVIATPGP